MLFFPARNFLPFFDAYTVGGLPWVGERTDGDSNFGERRKVMTLEEMKAVDVRTVDPDTLVDIRDVHIDRSLPKEERIRS